MVSGIKAGQIVLELSSSPNTLPETLLNFDIIQNTEPTANKKPEPTTNCTAQRGKLKVNLIPGYSISYFLIQNHNYLL